MRSEEMQMKAKEDHHWAENQNEKRKRKSQWTIQQSDMLLKTLNALTSSTTPKSERPHKTIEVKIELMQWLGKILLKNHIIVKVCIQRHPLWTDETKINE